ncbi:primase C-terminal domain-containing protein [Bacillus haynesii]|uniref:primase C-terminal domain-containing protein n=1 Tax=Bacillus haynesii TaxID=1925021 RepID=UPI002282C9D3|nr:primase C-terminal domain-containing protein [Bacillus haynesii]MCY8577102.1 primase C-terminal domain-containing protein [Bacillus haynesii]MEC1657201.1 primase C-terminal domain-containing protein [Bacillus haynesii]
MSSEGSKQSPITNLWVECGADIVGNEKFPFRRKFYMFPEYVWQFRDSFQNKGVYQTVMQYINPIWYQNQKGKWLINASDSLKWGDFYLDFDTVLENEEDYEKIKEDVRTALRYITVIMNIDMNQVRFFFSGGKGIHLTIPAITLGLEPHVALNQIYKMIAEDISQYCKHKTLDTKVYDDKRMFRMVNSWNIKGQAYKIPLTFDEFVKLKFSEIRALAQFPREISVSDPVPSARARVVINQHIEDWTNKVNRRQEFSGKLRKLDKEPPCIKAMWEKIFRETVDERNNSGTALASFYMQQGIEYEETLARLYKWNNEHCSPKQKDREIEIIVQSVYNGQYKYGCETFKRVSGVCDKENCPLFKQTGAEVTPLKG